MNAIGKVKFLTSPALVERPDGRRWRLYQHNNIFVDDRIFTNRRQKIEILLNNNNLVVIEDGQSWTPTQETHQEMEEYFSADATISDSAKGKASAIEQLLQCLLVEEVTSRSMRSFNSENELLNSELHFAERWSS